MDPNCTLWKRSLAAKAASYSGSYCKLYNKKTGECLRRREVFPLACENEKIQICHFTDHVEIVVNGYGTGLLGQLVSASIYFFTLHVSHLGMRAEELEADLRIFILRRLDFRF